MKNFFLLTFLFSLVFAMSTEAKDFNNYKDFYDRFADLKPDSEHIYKVRDVFISQDAATTILDSGIVYFMQDIGEGKHVAIFLGHGSFELSPPIEPEKQLCRRHFGNDYYTTTFTKASFIFDDDFFETISTDFPKTSFSDKKQIEELFSDTWKSFVQPQIENVYSGIAYAILEKGKSEFFLAEFFTGIQDQYVWIFNPADIEECNFYRTNIGTGNSERDMEIILSFDRAEDYLLSELERSKLKQKFSVEAIDINLEFSFEKKYTSTSSLKIAALDNLQWLKLAINPQSELVSVKDNKGRSVNFYHQKPTDYYSVWVNLPEVVPAGDTLTLTFVMKSKIKISDMLFASSLYPVDADQYKHMKFSLRVKSNQGKDVYAFGNKVKDEKSSEGYNITEWEYPDSLESIAIIFNNYKTKEINPEIGHKELIFQYNSTSNLDAIKLNYQIAFQYFSYILGKLPENSLKILQTPKEKRLTGSSYYFLDFTTEYTSSAGFFLCNRELAIPTEIFEEPGISAMIQFVHYLSSLWFDGMEAKSDRDHWLSFGLRQFLLSVYMEVFLEDKSISEKNWRDLHTYFLSLDDVSKDFEDYGCLSHGSIGGSRFRADSGAMNIKSLFIFHMLRNLFIDYNAAADKREVAFESMLREFYSTYKHSKYSVNDFRAILEKHFGAQLSWFFEQWVDGYEIPSYEFASKTVVNENGHYVVYCQVVQEDVSENFFMPVPVKVVFDDNSVYYTRAMIKGEKIKFEIGPFESEPKEVIFNPNYSVLSKTSSKSWEDDF